MKQEKTRDEELRDEFAAGRNPEDAAVLKERIDRLDERVAAIEHTTHTNI